MRAIGEKAYSPLAKGLITEASPLAFPEGATADELNFLFQVDGSKRVRRLGLENVRSDIVRLFGSGTGTILEGVYYWQKPDVLVVVYQGIGTDNGTYLKILKYDAGNFTSVNWNSSGADYKLNNNVCSVQIAENTDTLGMTLYGAAFGVDFEERPYLLEYDEEADQLNLYQVDLYIRDFELVEDNLRISQRPAALSPEHEYNLYNAGWYAERRLESTGNLGNPLDEFQNQTLKVDSGTATFTATNSISPITGLNLGIAFIEGSTFTISGTASNNGTYTVDSYTFTGRTKDITSITTVENTIVNEPAVSATFTLVSGVYPSNADISVLGLKVDSSTGDEEFTAETLLESVTGNTEAPRGHYVYNINEFKYNPAGTSARDDRRATPSIDGTANTTLSVPLDTVTL